MQPPAHRHLRSRRITALRIPAGIVSAYPMSSGRLGPPSRAPELPAAQEATPARPGRQQVDGLADDRLLQRGPGRRGVRAGVAVAAASPAEPVQFDAQPDQVLQRVHVHVPGHDRGHRRVARDRLGGVPVQPRAALAAGLGRERPARRPPLPDLRGPLLLQGGVGVEQQQVGQRDVHPGLDRLPGPLRQQASWRPAGAWPRPARRGTAGPGSGHRLSRPGRPARPAPARPPRRTPGSGPRASRPAPPNVVASFSAAVGEVPVRVLIGQVGRGPARTSPRTARPAPPAPARAAAAASRSSSDSSRNFSGSLLGPQADQPPDRLGDLPGGQRGQHLRVGARSAWPRRCARRRRRG